MKFDYAAVLIGAAATVVGMFVYDKWVKPAFADVIYS